MGSTDSLTDLSFQLAFGIIGMVLLTAFIVVFFIVYQRRLLQQQIQTQQMEVSYQKELLHAGILAQEAERKRIAIDLHDSIGGLLSTTKIYIANVSQELDPGQFSLFKEKALQALNENIQEVRTITNNLLPQSLERLGIVSAVRDLAEKFQELKPVKVKFEANAEERFDGDREKALFRILQELFHNALKHANAQEIALSFHFSPKCLEVFYQDDGQGFDRSAHEQNRSRKSFGLKNMESRIAFLNGKIHYETSPGNGVEVSLSIPLHEEKFESNGNSN